MNTAAATIRQLVSVVFERVVVENATNKAESQKPISDADMENLKMGGKDPPPSLLPCAQDAFLLFQVEEGMGVLLTYSVVGFILNIYTNQTPL